MPTNSTQIARLLQIAILLLSSFALVLSKTGPAHNKVVVCYLSSWAVYRPGDGSYSIEHFNPNLCTHVVYAFAGLDIAKDAIKSLDPWQDLKDDYGKGGYERLTGLKAVNPHLKVTLAIGGWNEGSKNYSILAANPERRARFAKQASEFVRKYKFDGLDLDWEYPTQRGGDPTDKENFVNFVKDLRKEFNNHRLLLTSAIGAAKKTIDAAYDVKSLAKLLDFMHIMCYDYGGMWDKHVSPNAPLSDDGELSVEYTIQHLIRLGAPPSKLVMGLPFYGRTFITNLDGLYGDASLDTSFAGPFTREDGFLGYNEICLQVSNKSSGWESSWDSRTSQGIARLRDDATGETKVVTYDTTRSIANKMKFAMNEGLAGAMVWSVDTDDFLGKCELDKDTFSDFMETAGVQLTIPKRTNANYPLLRTINEGIIVALDEIEQKNRIKEQERENEIPHGDESLGAKSGVVGIGSFCAGSLVIMFVNIICLSRL